MSGKTSKSGELHVPLSAVGWLILGVVLGSLFVSHFVQDVIDIYNGYRWNYLEKCIISPPNFAGGYCRVPKKCTCADVEGIDDVLLSDMTEELFREK